MATAKPTNAYGSISEVVAALKAEIKSGDSRIKERFGWKDKRGNEVFVKYLEWSDVADALDKHAPDWQFSIVSTVASEGVMFMTGELTINGVSRSGTGTAPVSDGGRFNEAGIKGAEADALKRAATKFGLGRFLYAEKDNRVEAGTGGGAYTGGGNAPATATGGNRPFTGQIKDPGAGITPAQLNRLNRTAEASIDIAAAMFGVDSLEALTKGQASAVIDAQN